MRVLLLLVQGKDAAHLSAFILFDRVVTGLTTGEDKEVQEVKAVDRETGEFCLSILLLFIQVIWLW